MIIAVSLSLRAYPSVSTGLNPSNGGSFTLHILVGAGFGKFRLDGGSASVVAEGAISQLMEVGGRQVRSWSGRNYIISRAP
jgi:hypothetical protein